MAIKGGDPILEKQNWSTWFFGMCAFMAFCYGCVIYQEFVSRRTYIYYQSLFRSFDHDKTQAEFDAFKKSWNGGAKEQELKKTLDDAQARMKEPAYRDAKNARPSQFLAKGYAKSERAKVKSTQDA